MPAEWFGPVGFNLNRSDHLIRSTHLASAGEQRRWNSEGEGLGGLDVDRQLILGRRLSLLARRPCAHRRDPPAGLFFLCPSTKPLRCSSIVYAAAEPGNRQ